MIHAFSFRLFWLHFKKCWKAIIITDDDHVHLSFYFILHWNKNVFLVLSISRNKRERSLKWLYACTSDWKQNLKKDEKKRSMKEEPVFGSFIIWFRLSLPYLNQLTIFCFLFIFFFIFFFCNSLYFFSSGLPFSIIMATGFCSKRWSAIVSYFILFLSLSALRNAVYCVPIA